MKFRYIATGLVTGLAGAAIAAAPIASAGIANPSTVTDTDRSILIDKQGHSAIVVKPPEVSPPMSYGEFATPQMAIDD